MTILYEIGKNKISAIIYNKYYEKLNKLTKRDLCGCMAVFMTLCKENYYENGIEGQIIYDTLIEIQAKGVKL